MTEKRKCSEERRRCMHHEGHEIRITSTESSVRSIKHGLFAIYTLLIANLFTVITLLVIELNQSNKKAVAILEAFIDGLI